jgi:hypothetical protein
LSDEDEPKAKASGRAAEPLSKSAAPRKRKQLEEKDCSNSSYGESKDYDENEMLIYTQEEEPNVLLVGSVIEVQVFTGSADEFLLVHRYGYVAHSKAAWTLDYTKP